MRSLGLHRSSPSERRKHARVNVEQPIKLRCELTGRYLAGSTTDLSGGGTMVALHRASMLVPGQRVSIGMARNASDALIRSDEMVPATVVRCLGMGTDQRVALQFDEPMSLSLAA